MKQLLYRILVIALSVIIGVLVHAAVEIPIISLLVHDFPRYNLGLTWQQWYLVHNVWSIVTFVGGALFGLWLGARWWQLVYIKLKRGKPKF